MAGPQGGRRGGRQGGRRGLTLGQALALPVEDKSVTGSASRLAKSRSKTNPEPTKTGQQPTKAQPKAIRCFQALGSNCRASVFLRTPLVVLGRMDDSAGSSECYHCLWCDPMTLQPPRLKDLRLWYKIVGVNSRWVWNYCGMCDSCVASEWKEYRNDFWAILPMCGFFQCCLKWLLYRIL